jgi:serine/threonine-protein kinase
MLERYALDGKLYRDGPAQAPVASINYGAGGIAYAIYRAAQRRRDTQLLALADAWARKALALANRRNGFYNSALGIRTETVGRVSLFHSASGLHCLRALVSMAAGDAKGADRAMSAFVAVSRKRCDNPDVIVGKAGLLLGCAEMLEAMGGRRFANKKRVRARGNEIARELKRLVMSEDFADSKKIGFLGIAHGWGGLIFALLRWMRATGEKADTKMISKLDELASLAWRYRGGLLWPVKNANAPATFMGGWCNGAAGHAMLFAFAHDEFRAKRFGRIAERAATGAWLCKVTSSDLCCGQAGVSYSMAALYRLNGSPVWLRRARAASRQASVRGEAAVRSKFFLRDALYKGAVGITLLAEELKQPESAAMPFFEPAR